MRGAASTSSGGADEALCSTPGKANFQRVTRLLISGGTRLLRDTFDSIYTPSVLPLRLNDPAVKKALKAAKLTKPLWDCLYPSPGAYGKSTDFDITLLFRLLRTICLLSPPPTGWDDLPNSTDHSLTADLARVKFYRNSVYGHVNENMEIEDSDFQRLWKEIKESLLRIAGNISTAKKGEWEKAIELLLKDPLTPEDERCVEELKRWYKNDLDVKKALEELTTTTQEGVSRLEREVASVNEGVEETSQVVEAAVRDIKDQIGQVQESVDRLSSSASATQSTGARLRLRIDATVGTESGAPPQLAVALQQRQDESHEQALDPIIEGQLQATESRVSSLERTQEVFNAIILKFMNNDELAQPNAFLKYMADVRKLLVLGVGQGSLLITVACGSLQILEDLWQDYLSGHLNQMVQEHLVTADILKDLDLVETKFIMKTTILEEDYRACREYFLHSPATSLPSTWDPMPRDKNGEDVIVYSTKVPPESSEYQEVEKLFQRTANASSMTIISVERIQNPYLYRSFQLRKQKMDKDNGGNNERRLFHGTHPDKLSKINTQGFNRSFSGLAYGTRFGRGVYFARDSSFSKSYASGSAGDRFMYLARVLVGQYCIGDPSMIVPPPKDPSRPEILFDSVVDQKENPSIFVVFYDNQCYPEYLIRFHVPQDI